jgi:hypothetical protein
MATAVGQAAQVAADLGEAWRQQAACRGRSAVMDPPGGLDGESRRQARAAARAVCDACPVLAACGAWVMSLSRQDDPGGMCAAMTPLQRENRRRAASKGRYRKRCTCCGKSKPVEQFYATAKSPDGRRTMCKACDQEKQAARRAQKAAG